MKYVEKDRSEHTIKEMEPTIRPKRLDSYCISSSHGKIYLSIQFNFSKKANKQECIIQ